MIFPTSGSRRTFLMSRMGAPEFAPTDRSGRGLVGRAKCHGERSRKEPVLGDCPDRVAVIRRRTGGRIEVRVGKRFRRAPRRRNDLRAGPRDAPIREDLLPKDRPSRETLVRRRGPPDPWTIGAGASVRRETGVWKRGRRFDRGRGPE